ncbi:MAG: hypothetical protein JNL82_24045 [Myxococcales bacterium]|nr:hypothetical protein [Myxococcales bacterium]
MTTQTFRVVRVRAVEQSPVARIEAVNEDGHELRLEAPADLVRGAAEGQLLLVHWSLVNQASAAQGGAARRVAGEPAVIVDAEFTTTGSTHNTNGPAQDPAAVDQEFMSLMNGTRTSKTFTGRDIDHELSTLLGSAGAKGQK